MSIKIAINGFGRIGRQAFKVALEHKKIQVLAINDLADPKTLAHLLKYDTAYGQYPRAVSFDEKNIIVAGQKFPVLNEKDPALLPWKKLKIDVVLENTGRFTKKEDAEKHIQAGAKKVIISAPAKPSSSAGGVGVPTYVLGVNGNKIQKETAKIVNNASCTTNCIAPVMAVLEDAFGIEKAMMTTIHAYTAEQNLQDAPPPGLKSGDLRRARAAGFNIVPTSTGAAKAVAEAIPSLKGIFDGVAFRVPILTGSLSDITVVLKKQVTKDEVNAALIKAVTLPRFKGILRVTSEPLVSSDFIGDSASSIVDLSLTNVVGGNLVKVVAWYDNEAGYAHRLVELAEMWG
ncbi:MAG: type I glyceraldehyde-3-phosphate dehydrogenase [Candidatus Magasanikbacteria bacterium]|nr:type I glyceraldehyde-3-phosphate dehydrogenase [Candidatus Magasanikbacteria bacterium]